jgi:hypothetical protein
MKIAIHGAEGTGKEVLAAELSRALDKRGGHQARIAVSPPLTSTDIAITFVCGLDWTENDSAPGLCAGTQRESEDTRLREALTAAGIDFQVVYGTSDVRVANALRAIDAMTGNLSIVHPSNAQVNLSTRNQQKWRWECDKCGDSSCEHRLFSELIR